MHIKEIQCWTHCVTDQCSSSTYFLRFNSIHPLACFGSFFSVQSSTPLPLLFCLLAPVWAIPAFEISFSSNPLIRVSQWDYHRVQASVTALHHHWQLLSLQYLICTTVINVYMHETVMVTSMQ